MPNQINDIYLLSPAESSPFTDHGTIVFQLETSKKAAPKQGRTVYNYKKGDFDGLPSAIEAIDLSNAIHQDDVNTSLLEWKDTFLAAVEDYIPTKIIKGRNSPLWINGGIVHALKRKEAVQKKLKKSPTDALKNIFKELRTRVKKMISASRTDFFNSLDADLSSNPKRFWSVFKLKSKNSRFPRIMSIGQRDGEGNQQARLATTPSSIASMNINAASRSSICRTSPLCLFPVPLRNHPHMRPTQDCSTLRRHHRYTKCNSKSRMC